MTNREMVKDPRGGGPTLPEPNIPQRVLVPAPEGDPNLFTTAREVEPSSVVVGIQEELQPVAEQPIRSAAAEELRRLFRGALSALARVR